MYKIVGADQKEYGPITADQIRQWIAEGRANAQTKQDPGRYTGIGLAKAGIIMSVAGLAIFGFLFFTGILSELVKNLPRFGR